jgi:hypothetical protein
MDFRITQGNTPVINDTLTDAAGQAVNLAGATVQFCFTGNGVSAQLDAEVVNSGTGAVRCALSALETAVPGVYRAQWVVTQGESVLSYPTDPLEFEIVAAVGVVPPANVSQLTEFCDPVRAILGDYKRVRYEDGAILSVLRTMLRMGRVPGYALTPDTRSVQPAIGNADVRAFALLVYHASKTLFMPDMAEYSYKTRAMSERFGEQRHFLFELQNALYELEFPEMFTSFQSYYSWVNSISGIDVWALMTDMKVNAPVASVSLGRGGIQVNTQ